MNDRPIIMAGLLVFLGAVTFPVWYNVAVGTARRAPALKLPATERACVAPRDFMRTSHMALLVTWRDDVVRRGSRVWTAQDGRRYDKNLTGTCLRCHSSKTDFCDRCHDYAGVAPVCGDCHVMTAQINPGRDSRVGEAESLSRSGDAR
jgi:hypothetical protein